jgi:hypothetical protein
MGRPRSPRGTKSLPPRPRRPPTGLECRAQAAPAESSRARRRPAVGTQAPALSARRSGSGLGQRLRPLVSACVDRAGRTHSHERSLHCRAGRIRLDWSGPARVATAA